MSICFRKTHAGTIIPYLYLLSHFVFNALLDSQTQIGGFFFFFFFFFACSKNDVMMIFMIYAQRRVQVDIPTLGPKSFIPKGFYSEGSFFRKVLSRRVVVPKGKKLSRRVVILKFRIMTLWVKIFGIMTLRDKNLRNNDLSR